jgi:xyloglucan-specific endo-beta-1,4-glucanase
VNIAGFNWDLYVGPNGSMKVFSFLPADGSWKFTFNADVKLFFNWLAANQGYPINQQNLISKLFDRRWRRGVANMCVAFQQGTEPFTGGPTKYTVSSYSASVNV